MQRSEGEIEAGARQAGAWQPLLGPSPSLTAPLLHHPHHSRTACHPSHHDCEAAHVPHSTHAAHSGCAGQEQGAGVEGAQAHNGRQEQQDGSSSGREPAPCKASCWALLERQSDYSRRVILMALWLLALSSGYLVERAACQLGLPYDCLRQVDFFEVFGDLSELALYGLVLGWFVGAADLRRARWLLSWRRWYLWVVFLGTPPTYSLISNVPSLKHDLATLSDWGPAFIALEAAGLAAILGVIAWHLRAAWRRAQSTGPAGSRWPEFLAYLLPRLLLLGWFGGGAAAVRASHGTVRMHLHHLYIGWSLALWAEFNKPISGLALAIGAGIFVQGIAAYSFPPVFVGGGCFETPAAAEVACSFSAPAAFVLRVCPAGGGRMPAHSCS